jgi:restriction system protein
MAEITRKRQGEMMRKVFEVLLTASDGLPAKEVLDRVASSMNLTEFEKTTYASNPNVRRFEKIVRFSSIPPTKAGWLVKSKGRWNLTEEGRRAYERYSDPEKFFLESVRLYREWEATRPEALEEVAEEEAGATSTLEEAEEEAWADIERYLKQINPYDLQKLVVGLLKAMSYHVSWNAPPGPDGGLDIVAHGDPLGMRTPRLKVQVKRRADKLNVEGLRAFMALLGDQDVGLLISTGGFTSDAEAEARKQERRRLTLVDLERLFDLWVENYAKIDEEYKALLRLRPIYYLAASV